MSFPNRYFGVRMWGDRYFGPVEDTGQFIAEVSATAVGSGVTSVKDASLPQSRVYRVPSYVFVPVRVSAAVQRPESVVSVTDVSASTSGPTSAPDPTVDVQAASPVTSEVRYFTLAVVDSTVNEKAN
jgi:hypothetical protein